jgi:hypothetical protein
MNRLAGLLLGCACLATAGAQNPRDLTGTEQDKVRTLAEKALKDNGLWKGKTVLTSSQVVLDSATTPPDRIAILTYYRYDGNLGIVLNIDLGKNIVTAVEQHPDMPTSLTAEEIAEAEKMARHHAGVQKALANYKHLDKIEVDTMVAVIISPEVPGYHHRVARLFFRDAQRNYLQLVPMVDVDLTSGEVRLDVIAGMHKK